ncbi:MAG: M15 family metallopeptidase [Bacilli bacterium]|nr:M15 family metallopeptidase [Bacilli bacterium]
MLHNQRRRKKIRLFILIISLIFLSFIIMIKGFYLLTTSKTERDLKKLKYNNESIVLIIENKLDKFLINNNLYSKTLEAALVGGQYENQLLEEYLYFPYKEYDSYISQLNNLNLIGYKRNDIEQVFNFLTKDEIDIIIQKEVQIDNLVSYISNDYFNINALDRYLQYKQENNSYAYDEVISRVNMSLDYPFYENTIEVPDPNDILVIVNKYYKLPKDFVPKKLIKIDNKYSYYDYGFQIASTVKDKFKQMANDAEKEGLIIKVTSAYRSYQKQMGIYNGYVKKNGFEAAEMFSARPGYSEHQTGLAIDVISGNNPYSYFQTTKEYKWLKDNAHKYGFILRYPENKSDITGYSFESWHYRYVGEEVAKYIYENNLTFDEYHAMMKNKKTNK